MRLESIEFPHPEVLFRRCKVSLRIGPPRLRSAAARGARGDVQWPTSLLAWKRSRSGADLQSSNLQKSPPAGRPLRARFAEPAILALAESGREYRKSPMPAICAASARSTRDSEIAPLPGLIGRPVCHSEGISISRLPRMRALWLQGPRALIGPPVEARSSGR